ncbi:hypothetical protein [Streptomyces lancefieldiae]|uniref:Uncharacterized protein n=1 Tax=Streptomyces lancefieldiae TaxID=3075520 RepID=A0ABU3AGB4_9ACTN|nr:hypothetical protein [Streptomyces sp. DSM 40712]MDT0608840.1 hypothetical protein [Streptomyces sp. DSM 40712]
MASFQIVTVDDQAHTEGREYPHFADLGFEWARLKSFEHDGDFLALHFEHDLTLFIPESRIKHIAQTPTD